MDYIYETDVIKLYSRSEQDNDGALKFYSNGDVKLFLGDKSICSRFSWFTDVAFEQVIFRDLHLNFVMNTQFEGEIDDRLHSFYCKYPRSKYDKKAEEKRIVNLSDIVKIKLKPEGVDIYYHQYDELIAKGLLVDRPMPVIDEQGYTKMQLWEVMQLFGPKLSLGAGVPFETDIVLED